MRQIAVTQLQNDWARALRWIGQGEEVAIARRGQVVARLAPPGKTSRKIKWPDFAARAHKTVPKPKGRSASETLL